MAPPTLPLPLGAGSAAAAEGTSSFFPQEAHPPQVDLANLVTELQKEFLNVRTEIESLKIRLAEKDKEVAGVTLRLGEVTSKLQEAERELRSSARHGGPETVITKLGNYKPLATFDGEDSTTYELWAFNAKDLVRTMDEYSGEALDWLEQQGGEIDADNLDTYADSVFLPGRKHLEKLDRDLWQLLIGREDARNERPAP